MSEEKNKEKDTSWPEYALLNYASEEKDPAEQARWHEGIGRAVHRAGSEHINTHYRTETDGAQLSELGEKIKKIYKDWLTKEKAKEKKERYWNTTHGVDAEKYYRREQKGVKRKRKDKKNETSTEPKLSPGQ